MINCRRENGPPGKRLSKRWPNPTLEPFTGVIDAILEGDSRVPKKQRHTAKRIYERLRDEYGFDGQYTLGVCLRNNVLNDNRLYYGNYYIIPHIEANYSRIMSEHNAIRL